MEDVSGKRIIKTRLGGNVTIREENATAALELMSRFAVDPKWLLYLPPTMSPSETTTQPGLLEHPAAAFAYFRGQGVPTRRFAPTPDRARRFAPTAPRSTGTRARITPEQPPRSTGIRICVFRSHPGTDSGGTWAPIPK
jgi:hypothetical protein